MRVRNAIAFAGCASLASAALAGPPVDLSNPSQRWQPMPSQPTAVSPEGCDMDDFNRANGPIGGSWVPGIGALTDWSIESNMGKYAGGGNGYMQHGTANAAYDSTDVWIDAKTAGASNGYVAAVTGLGGGDNLYIKVQSQDGSGTFHVAGFYHGFNGGGWPGISGGAAFFALDTPFTEGRLRLYITDGGDTVNLDIDTDFNGTADQTYSRGGVLGISGAFGMSFGIGGWGTSLFDNWGLCPPSPGCYPDCNNDQILNLADFGCFQTAFATGNTYADCNGDTLLNLADFGCFQTQFAIGCP